jgi:fructose-6-phosphate aldolase 1
MIELYLDTVDAVQVNRLNSCLPIKGVTTNPSILANADTGVALALSELAEIIEDVRFHVQVVSQTVDEMVAEAIEIDKLPFDMVVKIPATETGLAAIKKIKSRGLQVLATAIYSSQQGFLAALCGADYLAPYVNRIDTMGGNGVQVVADLQQLLTVHDLDCKVLPASFKNTLQVMDVMKLGVEAITLPVDVAIQMISHPAVEPAVEQFTQDWQDTFGTMLSFET